MAFASINQASVSGGSSNALSIQSDGIFMPRLSTGQRTALALTTSDAGLTVYDFTLNNLFIWNGAAWESIPGSGDAGANGSVQYNDNGIVSGATNFVWDKATGRVGVYTATPADFIEVVGSGANGIRVSRAGVPTQFATLSAGATGPTLNASSALGSLSLGINGITGVTLNSTNNLVLAGGTAGANGVGVTFPAGPVPSSDANCLDDYEEGVWFPTLAGQLGTSGQTYVTQSGRYTKIGRLVNCNFEVELSAVGTVTGLALIGGLPFTSVGTGVILNAGTFNIGFANNLATNQIFVTGYLVNGNISAFVTAIAAAGTSISNITATNIWGNTTRIAGSITYTAA
jgi:hypothetical protein